MSSVPLAANNIQPPPDPAAKFAQALQIKGLLLGQQYTAGAVQSQGISNQQRQMDLDAQQKIIAAQRDPSWDATDSDKTVQLLNHYQVPIEYQQRVLQGINQTRQVMQSQSSDTLAAQKNFHEFLDDQYQGVNAAPPAERQSAWEEAKQNALNYANTLPPGPARDTAAKQVQAVPALYDPTFIAREHGLLKTVTQVNAEALSKAQAAEAAGKGAQASAAAALDTGKITPGSPAFAPTPQALSLGASQDVPWAAPIQAGEAKQAGAVAGAEAGAKFPYEQQLEQLRQQTQLQIGTNKDAQDKIEGTVLKPYEDKMSQVSELQSAVQQAQAGNVTAARGVLLKLIGVTNPDGTKRYNEAEATRLMQQGSIPQRVQGSLQNLLTGDQWTPKMASDMLAFGDGQAAVARANLNRGIGNVNRLYGTNVGSGLTQSTVKMRAPNGQISDVDPSQVEHYKAKGATVVDDTSAPPAPALTTRPQ